MIHKVKIYFILSTQSHIQAPSAHTINKQNLSTYKSRSTLKPEQNLLEKNT